ncbi:MAG TPA: IS256 family transposase [Candidatus Sulfotelmatobacter sp.]|jgi:putative transposase|nr:IS256 family transposase [Candidatus Sulfotelmatobacter sp.]
MTIDPKLVDELLVNYKKPEDIIGENGLLKQLTKALLERALSAELTEHVGYDKHDPAGYNSGNSRNGSSKKKLKGEFGEIELETPRDRNGSFEPEIVSKGQTRFTGFDDKIISMYSRGMTTREIEGHLREMYGVDVSPTLISNVTEAVMEEVKTWQSRPLDEVYPILYMDALRVKVRDGAHVENKAIHVAIAVNLAGHKEVLGLWAAQNEGAKFWLQVLTELQNRGVKDIFIACVDGLKGFPEVIESVYPRAEVQICIVHMIRASLSYVNWKQRKPVAADLRQIYQAATAQDASEQLDAFAQKWDGQCPMVSQIWRRHWDRITPFLAYPAEIRKVIYTTNAVESLNMSLRKIIKMRGSFPNEEAALKLLYLALRNASKKWTMPIQNWTAALNRFSILWPDRMPAGERV